VYIRAVPKLSPSERAYLELVSEAAFVNPFGLRRDVADARLGAARKPSRRASLRELDGDDRVLVENAICFDAFHAYLGQLDALIERQEQAGDQPVRAPFAADLLHHLVSRGLVEDRARRILELFYQMRRAYYFIARGLVGESESMRKLRAALWEAVFTHDILGYERYLWNRMEDFSTILVGETGTGKGAAAAAIGRAGFIAFDEKKGAFARSFRSSIVAINLNELAENLFESEIFGHRKGAFTGAIDNHEGVLARCPEHGTVFFDEIGEATLPVQVKLLRVLQDREFTPVGSREPQRFTGRILAATHRSLAELRERGAMRDDFYYRLCSNVIEVPPLRTRIAESARELPMLVEHLCGRIAGPQAQRLAPELTAEIERGLGKGHTFPGNVRELEQTVRRILLTGRCTLADARSTSATDPLDDALRRSAIDADALVQRYCAALYQRTPSYVEVARITGLDRRTVKKHIDSLGSLSPKAGERAAR
jgi:DNA-binding NtrC family response regulator